MDVNEDDIIINAVVNCIISADTTVYQYTPINSKMARVCVRWQRSMLVVGRGGWQ
jgi:hypothetical protein